MSSGSSALLGLLFALVGCDRHQPDGTAMTGSTPVPLPVGPVPGPDGDGDASTMQNPFPSDQFTLNAGRIYFNRYNCSGCHGGRAGGGMGPSLRDEEWLYGSSDARIFGAIVQGRGHGMPAWGKKLPDDVAWKLVAYVKSLGTSAEPEAPDQTVPPPPPLEEPR